MNNRRALVAVLASIMTPASALAETTWFGTLDVSYGQVKANGNKDSQVRGTGSRVGVRGFQALDPKLDVTYMIEGFVSVEDNNTRKNTRQAWTGLRGDWGELRAGRQLGATQVSSEWVELFADQYGDYNTILESEVFHKESIAYINKSGAFGYAFEVSSDDDLSPKHHQVTATDFMINYQQGDIYAAAGTVRAKDNFRTNRFTFSYKKPSGYQVGTVLERHKPDAGEGYKAQILNGAYKSGQLTFKAQYGTNKAEAGGKKETLMATGVDYALDKKTRITLEYSVNQNREHREGDKVRTTAIGLVHSF
ncbi:porin [Thiolinea disciformis]|uniref:porin n=1 Tax=Thiolinea disciformis TaxID=125614 RepID=UPI00037C7833|nr:porin [Thiolinea disciformis]